MRDVYWLRELEGVRLAIMPRPRGGEWLEDEIAGWRAEGIDAMLSLLERSEVEERGMDKVPASITQQRVAQRGR